jgi:predicted nuclease with RNAse H fold
VRRDELQYRGTMLTVGVDLAAEPERTAVARIEWHHGRAVVRDVTLGAGDSVIVAAVAGAQKAGIDCPLGWPDAFVAFVDAHHAGDVAVPADVAGRDWRRRLAWRLTDEVVREQTGLIPLSVAADRIGHAAMRCAGLLALLAGQGQAVDRSGRGVVVEVYPAGSLKTWGLPHRGYKRPGSGQALGQLVDALLAAAPWLEPGPHEALCRHSHDAADAVVAALTARAASLGLASHPSGRRAAAASREGWIALPTSPLSDLA